MNGNTIEQSKCNSAWIMSLVCAQVILENQETLENSDKFRQTLKSSTKRFVTEVEKAIASDIGIMFDAQEYTSQALIGTIERVSKAIAGMNPAKLNELTKFIEGQNE